MVKRGGHQELSFREVADVDYAGIVCFKPAAWCYVPRWVGGEEFDKVMLNVPYQYFELLVGPIVPVGISLIGTGAILHSDMGQSCVRIRGCSSALLLPLAIFILAKLLCRDEAVALRYETDAWRVLVLVTLEPGKQFVVIGEQVLLNSFSALYLRLFRLFLILHDGVWAHELDRFFVINRICPGLFNLILL